MANKYKLTVTEEQLMAMMRAMEMYFRLDLRQYNDLVDMLASKNIDLDVDNPNHKLLFEKYLERRWSLDNMMRAIFDIAYPWNSNAKRDTDALRLEDIWQVCRHQLWKNTAEKRFGVVDSRPPFQLSDQDLPTIESYDE